MYDSRKIRVFSPGWILDGVSEEEFDQLKQKLRVSHMR